MERRFPRRNEALFEEVQVMPPVFLGTLDGLEGFVATYANLLRRKAKR